MTLSKIRLRSSATGRLRRSHPWIYRDDLVASRGAPESEGAEEAPAEMDESAAEAGGESPGVAILERPDGRVHGVGLYSPASRIAFRMLQRGNGPWEDFDLSQLVRRRILEAAAKREVLAPGVEMCRVVSSEADGLPGLVVDRYGSAYVVQTGTAALDARLDEIVGLLVEELGATVVVERNEGRTRRLEGLDSRSGVRYGALEGPLEYAEGPARFWVDLLEGQKTGAFLDQRDNRRRFAETARGRVLDAFCHDGWFGVQALHGGADHVVFLEQSKACVERIRANLALNESQASQETEILGENAFQALRSLRKDGRRFDHVVLDPPAFAKSRGEVKAAVRGYREINAQALRLVEPGGTLWTCSCSYNLSPTMFEDIVRSAASDAGRAVYLTEVRGQSLDHPVLLTLPESRYLKCLVLRVE